jgi:hypothetical protein|tara:strand:+ start:310 stop:513 length:204 start_codon:yes stop_codon:yes gene_type:complete
MDLFKLLCPDKWVAPKRAGGKRKKSDMENDHKPSGEKFLDQFKNESDLEEFYSAADNEGRKSIVIEE